MSKTPTAEEILNKHLIPANAMIEFAKLHVEAALEAKIEAMKAFENEGYSFNEINAFTRDSYSLEKIK
jgi:hypothetical protein